MLSHRLLSCNSTADPSKDPNPLMLTRESALQDDTDVKVLSSHSVAKSLSLSGSSGISSIATIESAIMSKSFEYLFDKSSCLDRILSVDVSSASISSGRTNDESAMAIEERNVVALASERDA